MPSKISGFQNEAVELPFVSAKTYTDPFNEIELDVIFEDQDDNEWRMPAFWAGGQSWRVRFAGPKPGEYSYRTECTDQSNTSLHGITGLLNVKPYEGANELLRNGFLRISKNRGNFEHRNGTPFLWLGDTWWMSLCHRLKWPNEFELLTADRVSKGFTVIQIVAGLYPDMPPFDERGANEAGYPWNEDYSRINPEYFDMADRRIQHLIDSGLAPCIVGFWGCFIMWMGEKRAKQHWRNLVARYGAYTVFWCIAGEGTMPYYLSESAESDEAEQRRILTTLATYVHKIDPYDHPVTVHPCGLQNSVDQVEDLSVIDFEMQHTGHSGYKTLEHTVKTMRQTVAREPKMPAILSEVNYEGIMAQNHQDIQRYLFWSCMLSGGAGHTYGANGLWQLNRSGQPHGPSPHGMSWGNTPWDEACHLPGSREVGIGKKLLCRYPWSQFEPHQEWIEPHSTDEDFNKPFAAGIPRVVRVFYLPGEYELPVVKLIESDTDYEASYFNPSTGEEYPVGKVEPDSDGNWVCSKPPIVRDWVLVMRRTD